VVNGVMTRLRAGGLMAIIILLGATKILQLSGSHGPGGPC
jgi:hypothetical protein